MTACKNLENLVTGQVSSSFSQCSVHIHRAKTCMRTNGVYGVYASQLIFYASCCSNYSDFLSRHRALVTRLLSQGYKVNRYTFKKFYGRHTDLVGQYKKISAKCFLILSVEMIFIFDGFIDGQINTIS